MEQMVLANKNRFGRQSENWRIRLGEEYLGILYDHRHKRLYDCHVIQAGETQALVSLMQTMSGIRILSRILISSWHW